MNPAQLNLGAVLVAMAARYLDIASGVPEEYVAEVEAQAEAFIASAALFGDEDAMREVANATRTLQYTWSFA
jgi:expansin (peptidoglycan-binding protein)